MHFVPVPKLSQNQTFENMQATPRPTNLPQLKLKCINKNTLTLPISLKSYTKTVSPTPTHIQNKSIFQECAKIPKIEELSILKTFRLDRKIRGLMYKLTTISKSDLNCKNLLEEVKNVFLRKRHICLAEMKILYQKLFNQYKEIIQKQDRIPSALKNYETNPQNSIKSSKLKLSRNRILSVFRNFSEKKRVLRNSIDFTQNSKPKKLAIIPIAKICNTFSRVRNKQNLNKSAIVEKKVEILPEIYNGKYKEMKRIILFKNNRPNFAHIEIDLNFSQIKNPLTTENSNEKATDTDFLDTDNSLSF